MNPILLATRALLPFMQGRLPAWPLSPEVIALHSIGDVPYRYSEERSNIDAALSDGGANNSTQVEGSVPVHELSTSFVL
jgi:hypothetical protein